MELQQAVRLPRSLQDLPCSHDLFHQFYLSTPAVPSRRKFIQIQPPTSSAFKPKSLHMNRRRSFSKLFAGQPLHVDQTLVEGLRHFMEDHKPTISVRDTFVLRQLLLKWTQPLSSSSSPPKAPSPEMADAFSELVSVAVFVLPFNSPPLTNTTASEPIGNEKSQDKLKISYLMLN